ncbi:MAG: hypothetical protein WD274_03745 [Acidimicrobiia bacterium]
MKAVAVAILCLLTACSMEPPGAPGVSNGTGETIDVFLVGRGDDGENVKVFTLPPASGARITEWLVGDCTGHELLAVTEDGQEVERREPGLCLDDVWRVNGDPSD